MSGKFIISLDYEKAWGFNDLLSEPADFSRFEGVDDIVNKILDIFSRYDFKATWAVVTGMLDHSDDIFEHRTLESLTLDNDFTKLIAEKKISSKAYRTCINNIAEAGHEIASHTHTHIYCDDRNFSICEIINDIRKSVEFIEVIAGKSCESIVFPRNQVSEEILKTLQDNKVGIKFYRGNNTYISDAVNSKLTLPTKLIRFFDSYLPISRTSYSMIEENEFKVVNIPASRFLRITKSSLMNKVHLRRIKSEMTKAAITSQNYHLWWHPHNFLVNENSAFFILDELLKHYHHLAKEYNFKCSTMKDILVNEK